MFKNPGTKWPIILLIATIGVIFSGYLTIKVALNNPVEMSNYGMQSYQAYDNNANKIITAQIAFDQKYTISFLTSQITPKATVIEYALADKAGKAVDDGKIEVVLTRPNTRDSDINLSMPTVSEGKYTFAPVDLLKAGRWDILAKVSVGSNTRYYNLKADTRNSNTFEF